MNPSYLHDPLGAELIRLLRRLRGGGQLRGPVQLHLRQGLIRIPAELREPEAQPGSALEIRFEAPGTVRAVLPDGSTRVWETGPLESWLQDLLPSVRGRGYLRTQADAAAYRKNV
ncbi:MAG: hypothetical protein NW241_18380 [Bacteroidia bacterium]|nr:hypothetical protein [Bacteroidia bacterium]